MYLCGLILVLSRVSGLSGLSEFEWNIGIRAIKFVYSIRSYSSKVASMDVDKIYKGS